MEYLASLFFYDQSNKIFLLKNNSDNGITLKPIQTRVESAENASGALIRILKRDFKFDLKDFHFLRINWLGLFRLVLFVQYFELLQVLQSDHI